MLRFLCCGVLQQENWDVVVKSDNSPLTKADKAANEVICNALMRVAPHIPIISEENKQLPYEIRKVSVWSWVGSVGNTSRSEARQWISSSKRLNELHTTPKNLYLELTTLMIGKWRQDC